MTECFLCADHSIERIFKNPGQLRHQQYAPLDHYIFLIQKVQNVCKHVFSRIFIFFSLIQTMKLQLSILQAMSLP